MFLEMEQTEVYKKDLKKLIKIFPEGVMACKRFGKPHIKLWNNELVRMFSFEVLPKLPSIQKTQGNGRFDSKK